jgi:wyosine [tRNA(Phe)-imidazoG37] synthetase (radical SAM superfamily)
MELRMYIFGPVPSRRLGLSLGIDLLGKKTCNLNCIYCELGRTNKVTNERKVLVPTKDMIDELKEFFAKGGKADYITFSGAGEPTLALNLGEAIDEVRKISDCKIALLTNGVLFYDEQVRREAAKADLVMPSIDAATKMSFLKVNRPERSLNIGKVVEGLIQFSKEYKGELHIEVLVVKGFNDTDEEIMAIRDIINKMPSVKKIQVNTVVRARAEEFAGPVSPERLKEIQAILGPKAEVIGEFKGGHIETVDSLKNEIFSIAKLRPVTADEFYGLLSAEHVEIDRCLDDLVKEGKVEIKKMGDKFFYIGKL